MKAQDYIEIIKQTAVFPDTVTKFGVAYAYIGIVDELDELNDLFNGGSFTRTALVKESGDVVWYITALSQELKLDSVKILSASVEFHQQDFNSRVYNIEKLAGKVKKFYRDDKAIDREFATNCLMTLVSELKWILIDQSETNNFDWEHILWEEVLATNYNKLMRRRETNTLHGDGDYREEQANGQA